MGSRNSTTNMKCIHLFTLFLCALLVACGDDSILIKPGEMIPPASELGSEYKEESNRERYLENDHKYDEKLRFSGFEFRYKKENKGTVYLKARIESTIEKAQVAHKKWAIDYNKGKNTAIPGLEKYEAMLDKSFGGSAWYRYQNVWFHLWGLGSKNEDYIPFIKTHVQHLDKATKFKIKKDSQ